jgi:hypothetical protein
MRADDRDGRLTIGMAGLGASTEDPPRASRVRCGYEALSNPSRQVCVCSHSRRLDDDERSQRPSAQCHGSDVRLAQHRGHLGRIDPHHEPAAGNTAAHPTVGQEGPATDHSLLLNARLAGQDLPDALEQVIVRSHADEHSATVASGSIRAASGWQAREREEVTPGCPRLCAEPEFEPRQTGGGRCSPGRGRPLCGFDPALTFPAVCSPPPQVAAVVRAGPGREPSNRWARTRGQRDWRARSARPTRAEATRW